MAPEMAVRISASVGSGFSSSSARVVISMPGVQKPHWRACSSWNPCWIGSSWPSTSSDSTVRTSCPSHITVKTVQDLIGWPSSSTTQAPQFEVSQPQWVPVRSSVSRRKCTSSRRGSTSRLTTSPLTVIETSTSGLRCQGARGGPPQRSVGQDAGQVTLVVHRPAAVRGGRAVLGGDLRGLPEQLLGRRLAAQQLLGPAQVDGGEADGGEGDAGVGDRASVQPDGGGGCGDGPVAGAALDLLVGAAAARPDG